MQPFNDNQITNYLPPGTPLIEPDERAHRGLYIPEIMREYGEMRGAIRSRLPVLWRMVRGMFHIWRGYAGLKRNPGQGKTQIDAASLTRLRGRALELGCMHVGYTQVPRSLIFSNQKLLFDQAIVLTQEMNPERIARAPALQAGKEVWRTYDSLGWIVNQLAEELRASGYAVQPGSPMGGEVNYVMLAQKAGLGHVGKHGLLIAPGTGPSLRIAALYTQIENLPYTDSDEHAWIADLCRQCRRCVRVCPGQAIYAEDIVFEDGSHQCIDYRKCAVPFARHLGCSVCIKECTFFQGDYARIKSRFLKS